MDQTRRDFMIQLPIVSIGATLVAADAAAQAPIKVIIDVVGGFGWFFGTNVLNVGAFKKYCGVEAHGLWLRREMGTVVSGSLPASTTDAWDLSNCVTKLKTDDHIETTLKRPGTGSGWNSLRRIISPAEISGRPVVGNWQELLHARLELTRGAVQVEQPGNYCALNGEWKLVSPEGGTAPRPLSDKCRFVAQTRASEVRFDVAGREAGAYIAFRPEDGVVRVKIAINATDGQDDPYKYGHELSHVKVFYEAVQGVGCDDRKTPRFFKYKGAEVACPKPRDLSLTPGEFCPPAFYFV